MRIIKPNNQQNDEKQNAEINEKLSDLKELYDFYSNGTYFFVRTNGASPYEELGELKLAPRLKILLLCSRMRFIS